MAAAARSLNLSASAVAQQLRALERELGVPLLTRIGRTVKVTDQGSRILNHARQLVRDSANLRGLAHDGSIGGELRLGACSTALIGILPQLMAKVTAKYPDIRFRVESANSVQLYTQLLAGNLDAACVLEAPYPLPKTCEWLLIREEPLVVLAPAAMANRDPLDLLRDEPFIRYDRNKWGGRGPDKYLRELGITPNERYEVDMLQAIAVMVNLGLGVSLVPQWSHPWPSELDIVAIPLRERRIGRRVGIVWSRSSIRIKLVNALLAEIDGPA
ncbi:DNA-binding transcriptional LysR family regulator [Sphingomonas jinjuensis]|uniref:DNA-binding transcriptional LysR family regulator n=1 Tax=Sphingomonas jinjuensis TaxID=535907 RepID=A0A840F8I4_9SPHN|nr:LysR substrate-binding domain-containing protein [Sphingomonas jinjuensis]MBB4155533.1 DNA-binding transcriptional LysR family regulator [Sphingomonas jinjuensis]